MKELGLIAVSPPPENKIQLDAYGHALVFKTGEDARQMCGPYINLIRLVKAKMPRKPKVKDEIRQRPLGG